MRQVYIPEGVSIWQRMLHPHSCLPAPGLITQRPLGPGVRWEVLYLPCTVPTHTTEALHKEEEAISPTPTTWGLN